MAETKSGPAGGGTPVSPGLTANKERLMTNRINPKSDHKATCRVFLELAADDLAKAKRTRDYYAVLARKYGLTNAEIGDALGMTEARVRQIVSASGPECGECGDSIGPEAICPACGLYDAGGDE